MIEWPIDCATFLRLTSAQFGEYGLHFIAPSGVSARRSADDIAKCNVLSTGEAADLLEFVAAAKLEFPTSTSALLQWVQDQHGDFVLPGWFIAAAEAATAEEARHILLSARLQLVASAAANHDRGSKSGDLPQGDAARLTQEEARAELDALDVLERALATGQAQAVQRELTQPARRPARRKDDLADEIEEIVAALKRSEVRITAPRVMQELQSLVGKPGSCVIDVAGNDAILWSRASSGGVEKLDLKALSKRLKL